MDNNNEKRNIFTKIDLNTDIIKQAKKLKKMKSSIQASNPVFHGYNLIKNINEPEYKDALEVIEAHEAEANKLVAFEGAKCNICGTNIDSIYYWYYLKHSKNESKSVSLCCLECLKKYKEANLNEINNFEVFEYSRCTAYYKCKDLDNLRAKCQRSKNLTSKDNLIPNLINFCESSQSGVILATHKMNEILKEFSEESHELYKESNDLLKDSTLQTKEHFKIMSTMLDASGNESKKQFRVTCVMTLVATILTVVNIAVSVLTYKNNSEVVELKKLNKEVIYMRKTIDSLTMQNKNTTMSKTTSQQK